MQEAMLRGQDADAEALVRGAFAAAREALERAAGDGGLRDLATTLLVLFARGDRMAIGHLGDGVILDDDGGAAAPLFLFGDDFEAGTATGWASIVGMP